MLQADEQTYLGELVVDLLTRAADSWSLGRTALAEALFAMALAAVTDEASR